MEKITDILSSVTSAQVFGWAGIIFGIVTLIGYFTQKKSNKDLKDIIRFLKAEKDIEELTEKRDEMYSEVHNKIPIMGKIAILKEQSDYLENLISANFESLNEINSKLAQLGVNNDNSLDEGIKRQVLMEISPKFRLKELKSDLTKRIFGLLLLIVVIGILVPRPNDNVAQIPLCFFLIYLIFKYFVFDSVSESSRKSKISKMRRLLIITAAAIVLSTLMVLYQIWNLDYITDFARLLVATISALGIVFLFINKIIFKKMEAKWYREIENASRQF